jgi:hypothetical protein
VAIKYSALAAVAVFSSTAITACSGAASTSGPASVVTRTASAPTAGRTIRAAPYVVYAPIGERLGSPLHRNIFTAEVLDVGRDTYVKDLAGGMVMEAVYTPVKVKVLSVTRGNLAPGDVLVLRAMGGTAEGLTFSMEGAPDKSSFKPGGVVVAAGGDLATLDGDAMQAMTPDLVAVRQGEAYVDASWGASDRPGAAESVTSKQMSDHLAKASRP